jgi:hypothetical protein
MTLFLLLTNLIGGLIAIQLFRGDVPANTEMNFKQTFNAFLAMYQVRIALTTWISLMLGL